MWISWEEEKRRNNTYIGYKIFRNQTVNVLLLTSYLIINVSKPPKIAYSRLLRHINLDYAKCTNCLKIGRSNGNSTRERFHLLFDSSYAVEGVDVGNGDVF